MSRDTAGRYFVSMAIEEAIAERAPAPGGRVGLDLGTTPLAILGTGEKRDHPRALARHREPLGKLQQRLARQRQGSRRRACTQAADRPAAGAHG